MRERFRDQDDTILVPITTAMYRLLGKEHLDSIAAEVKDPAAMDDTQDDIYALIKRLHRLKSDDEDSFQIRNMSDIRRTLEATTKTMSVLLGSIAGISLLVGGIGIMNIMLVSVSERTREIGLRKAVGAKPAIILMQFLVEAVALCVVGGAVGLGVAQTAVLGLSQIDALKHTAVPMWAVAMSVGFAAVTGVIFGMFPAVKAPVDVLFLPLREGGAVIRVRRWRDAPKQNPRRFAQGVRITCGQVADQIAELT